MYSRGSLLSLSSDSSLPSYVTLGMLHCCPGDESMEEGELSGLLRTIVCRNSSSALSAHCEGIHSFVSLMNEFIRSVVQGAYDCAWHVINSTCQLLLFISLLW